MIMINNNKMSVVDSIPWVEKYRPRALCDMTQDKNLIDLFKNKIVLLCYTAQ